jgi:hypothetical protein
MGLMVMTSNLVFAGILARKWRNIASDVRANGGILMWMKETNDDVVHATKKSGATAQSAADDVRQLQYLCWRIR